MSPKVKSILRKVIYFILFAGLFACFILLSNKYTDNNKKSVKEFNDYYENVSNNSFEVVNSTKVIKLIKNGKNIIFIGNSKSEWSTRYAEQVDLAVSAFRNVKGYYYDLNNDKALLNSHYYDIIDNLEGSLVTTDAGDNSLLAPSFYIIEDGKVLYYNVDTVAMKNTDEPDKYWTIEKHDEFVKEITDAIKKYYLNNEE